MTETTANFATTTLNGAITNTATSITVASSTGFPGPNFRAVIQDSSTSITNRELVLVTAVSGANWTVTRGIEGTSNVAHGDTSYVAQVLTSGGLAQLISEGGGVIAKIASSTAGDITLTATSDTAVNTALDLVFSSAEVVVGDVVGVLWVGLVESSGSVVVFNMNSMVSGSPVNAWGVLDPASWRTEASIRGHGGAMLLSTIQSGDLDAGSLTLRFFYRLGSAVNKTLYQSAGLTLLVQAINFGQ